MAGMMKGLETINSAVRTFVALVVVGMLGIGGWYGYATFNAADLAIREKDKELEQRNQRITALEGDLDIAKKRAEKLEIAVRLLKVERRLAHIDILDQTVTDGTTYTDVAFTEVNDQGRPISEPQKFRLTGKVMHVDGWVVKFEDRFVEVGDSERGTSLFVFKKIYGDDQKPIDGFALDKPGKRPDAYGTNPKISDFEQKIWDDFWDLAYDENKKNELGVRSSHGTSVFIDKLRKGLKFKISMRATGELDLKEQVQSP